MNTNALSVITEWTKVLCVDIWLLNSEFIDQYFGSQLCAEPCRIHSQ